MAFQGGFTQFSKKDAIQVAYFGLTCLPPRQQLPRCLLAGQWSKELSTFVTCLATSSSALVARWPLSRWLVLTLAYFGDLPLPSSSRVVAA